MHVDIEITRAGKLFCVEKSDSIRGLRALPEKIFFYKAEDAIAEVIGIRMRYGALDIDVYGVEKALHYLEKYHADRQEVASGGAEPEKSE